MRVAAAEGGEEDGKLGLRGHVSEGVEAGWADGRWSRVADGSQRFINDNPQVRAGALRGKYGRNCKSTTEEYKNCAYYWEHFICLLAYKSI